MGGPNEIALDSYLREVEDADAWQDAQVAVDQAILDCEGKTPDSISWAWAPDEWEELLAKTKAHRASGGRGAASDWQAGDPAFEHVHGARDDRTSEHD